MIARISSRLTDKNKKLLIALVLAAIGALFYQVVFSWYLPEYNRLQAAIGVLEGEVTQLHSSIADVKDLEKKLKDNLASMERKMDSFRWQVLGGEPVLVLQDQTAAQQLHFTSFNHGQRRLTGSIWEVTFHTAAKGPFEAVFSYLQHLDSQEKAMQIKDLKLKFPYSFDEQQKDEILVEIELAAFGIDDYQEKAHLDSTLANGSRNIFEPAVYLPAMPPYKPPVAEQRGAGNLPSYSFPNEGEINKWD